MCTPDADPVLDEPGLVQMLNRTQRLVANLCTVGCSHPWSAWWTTHRMLQLSEAGCVGFSHDALYLTRWCCSVM